MALVQIRPPELPPPDHLLCSDQLKPGSRHQLRQPPGQLSFQLLGRFDCSAGIVNWVWRSDAGSFEHVLINAAEDVDAFMTIVLGRSSNTVVGHRLLNLKNEYGSER